MKMSNVIAFDLEIVKSIPDGVEWKDIRPLGISCAAGLLDNEPLSRLWFHKDEQTEEPLSGGMSQQYLKYLVQDLMFWVNDGGYTIVTWNGLGFDFDVLAEESGMHDECKELALNHIDMMFHFLCVKGFPVGLDAVAKGLSLGGKKAGMTGADAPQLWASENLSDRLKVLRYVHQDSLSTLEIYEKATQLGAVNWITKKGKYSHMPLFRDFKTVKECLEFPLPDTSWMDNPLTREEFYAWTEK
jgi:hypothetical protein